MVEGDGGGGVGRRVAGGRQRACVCGLPVYGWAGGQALCQTCTGGGPGATTYLPPLSPNTTQHLTATPRPFLCFLRSFSALLPAPYPPPPLSPVVGLEQEVQVSGVSEQGAVEGAGGAAAGRGLGRGAVGQGQREGARRQSFAHLVLYTVGCGCGRTHGYRRAHRCGHVLSILEGFSSCCRPWATPSLLSSSLPLPMPPTRTHRHPQQRACMPPLPSQEVEEQPTNAHKRP